MIFRFVYFFLFGTVISIRVWARWKRWFPHFRAGTKHPTFVAEQSTLHCAVDLDKWRVHVAAVFIRIFTHRNDSIAYIPWYGETWAGAYRVVGTWHERITASDCYMKMKIIERRSVVSYTIALLLHDSGLVCKVCARTFEHLYMHRVCAQVIQN